MNKHKQQLQTAEQNGLLDAREASRRLGLSGGWRNLKVFTHHNHGPYILHPAASHTRPGGPLCLQMRFGADPTIKKEVAEEVILKNDGEDDEEMKRLDGLLKQIVRDMSPVLKDHAARSLSECKRTDKQTKIYLVKAYEKITGKKIL